MGGHFLGNLAVYMGDVTRGLQLANKSFGSHSCESGHSSHWSTQAPPWEPVSPSQTTMQDPRTLTGAGLREAEVSRSTQPTGRRPLPPPCSS